MTADFRMPNYQTREGFIETIRQAGEYIADHAENLLGEYPSLLSEMDITARFRFDEVPTIEVRRKHLTCTKEQYADLTRRNEKPLERRNSQNGTDAHKGVEK